MIINSFLSFNILLYNRHVKYENLKTAFLYLLLLLIFSSPCFAKTELDEKVDNGKIKIFYIRARDYQQPSNNTRTEAGKELINLINSANKTIDFAFYGLSHQDEIVNALISAQKRGIKVRGIVDMNIYDRNDYSETLTNLTKFKEGTIKTDYKTDITKKEKVSIEQLNSLSEYDFKGHIMHNKFCVVDNEFVWTGTANVSSSGTGGYNENVVLVINSKNLAKIYTKEMNEMYNNENFHEDKKEIYTDGPLLVGNIETKVYFSPSTHAIDDGIIPEIRNAKHYIYLSLFLLSRNDLVQELIKAKRRGVDVRLITESNHAIRKYSMHEYLRKKGIPVKVENWGGKMHAKLAVIDDNTIIVGSTNWTKTAIMYNDENMLILKNAIEQAKFLKNEFELSFKSIPDKWLYSNPQPEGADSPGSCFDGLDNNYNGLIDGDDPACFGVKY